MSLSEQLLELTTPAPKTSVDPEDQAWDGRVTFDYEAELEEEPRAATAKLRRAPVRSRLVAPVAETADPAYRGKRVSRKTLQDSDEEAEDVDEAALAQAEERERVMKARKKMAQMERDRSEEEGSDAILDSAQLDSESSDPMPVDEASSEVDPEERELERRSEANAVALTTHDKEAADREMAKAATVRDQFGVWDAMLQLRVAIQEPLQMSCRFPLPDSFPAFSGSAEVAHSLSETKGALRGLIHDLREMQAALPLPTVEEGGPRTHQPLPLAEGEDPWNELLVAYETLEPPLRQVLDKWQMRTLYSGAQSGTQFKALNKSVTAQVDEILLGTTAAKLIARSQPSPVDRILGESAPERGRPEPELFDDGEFYNQVLKDLIQAGSTSNAQQTTDPIAMSQEYLRLRRLRKRAQKRQKDRDASKGRRIKYEPLEKLVAFMAPQPQRYPELDTTRTQILFRSLFGLDRAGKDAHEAPEPLSDEVALIAPSNS